MTEEQIKFLQETLKAHGDRVLTPEVMSLAQGLRALGGIPKVTIRPTLPAHGRVFVIEDVLDLSTLENKTTQDQSK